MVTIGKKYRRLNAKKRESEERQKKRKRIGQKDVRWMGVAYTPE
jgi:hypothetical protein